MNTVSNAQNKTASLAGEYYLQGVMEMASGFQLREDSSFQFFFSYGALDRFGQGKWSVKDSTVFFESSARPGPDFKLVRSRPTQPGKISVQMENMHPALLPHVHCVVKSGNQPWEGKTNSKGLVTFNLEQADSIELTLEFCPEKKSVFKIDTKAAQQFVFEPEPWLMEVFFQGFRLQITGNGLAGGHPLSDKKDFQYTKN